jgi:hypothetical protein
VAAVSAPSLDVQVLAVTETVQPATPDELPKAVVVAAEPDIDPMFFADNAHDGQADPVPNDRPAWVELIDSLRQDIERLKAERTQPQEAAPPVAERPRFARPPLSVVMPPASTAEPGPSPVSKIRKLTPRVKPPKPIQDQWGLFDPEQCGFAALRAKLDEIGARDEASV